MNKLGVRLSIALLAFVVMPWTAFADARGGQLTTYASSRVTHISAMAAKQSAKARINSFLARLEKLNLFMGSILIADKSGVVMDKGYGYSNWESHVRNTQATKFRLADGSLQFTATAVLQLQEAGKLSVKDKACTYLASCPAAWKDVTIQQLLNHTSGIPSLYNDGVTNFYDWKYWTPDQLIGLVKDMPLLFKPGTDFHYSPINYIALGLIVEKASGQPFGSYLHEHIFQPLGMANSGLTQKGVSVPGLARGYHGDNRITTSQFDPSWLYAAGDVYSTVNDVYLWDQALNADKALSTASIASMLTPSFSFSKDSGYGYGFQIESFSGHRLVLDGGGMPGAATINAFFPDDGVTVILLENNDNTSMDVIFPYVAAAVLGVKVPQQTAG